MPSVVDSSEQRLSKLKHGESNVLRTLNGSPLAGMMRDHDAGYRVSSRVVARNLPRAHVCPEHTFIITISLHALRVSKVIHLCAECLTDDLRKSSRMRRSYKNVKVVRGQQGAGRVNSSNARELDLINVAHAARQGAWCMVPFQCPSAYRIRSIKEPAPVEKLSFYRRRSGRNSVGAHTQISVQCFPVKFQLCVKNH